MLTFSLFWADCNLAGSRLLQWTWQSAHGSFGWIFPCGLRGCDKDSLWEDFSVSRSKMLWTGFTCALASLQVRATCVWPASGGEKGLLLTPLNFLGCVCVSSPSSFRPWAPLPPMPILSSFPGSNQVGLSGSLLKFRPFFICMESGPRSLLQILPGESYSPRSQCEPCCWVLRELLQHLTYMSHS